MRILNYKGHTFTIIEEENFFVAYFNFIDYNAQVREVCITRQYVGRECFYLAKLSGLTTEFTGGLIEVFDKVIKHYQNNQIEDKQE